MRLLCTFLALLLSLPAYASIDQAINDTMAPITNAVSSVVFYKATLFGVSFPMIVAWLVIAATAFTLYFRFINIRGAWHGLRLIRGDYSDKNNPGEVSHFQALSTALSGTVGLGNIAGVAIAITIGGPGATFWLIVAGLLGMSSKFIECTLAVKYRKVLPDGSISGGPMYYLSRGIAENYPSLSGFGRVLGVVFAICCIGGALGGGNMFQANQSHQQLVLMTGGDASWFIDKGWLFGLVMASLVGLVIIGGIKSIARVTGKLVPLMAVIYLTAGLFVLITHIGHIPAAFAAIIDGAFSPQAAYGGIIGVLIVGFQRAAFSNEAGIGSAAIAHSAVKTKEPITEGLVALWEPFIDTVVICTMTALVIIITDQYVDAAGLTGVQLTSNAFASVVSWFPYVLSVAVFLFAYSTMLSWSYYGLKATTYLFGESRSVEVIYKLMFLGFVVLGCSINLSAVVDFSDAMIFIMSVPNVIGLYLLAPVIRRELNHYMARLDSGEIAPNRK